MHQSKSTNPNKPEERNMYLLENQFLDFIDLGQAYLHLTMSFYNEDVERSKTKVYNDVIAFELDKSQKESINGLFR